MDLLEFSDWKARVSDPVTSQQSAEIVQFRLAGLRLRFVEGVKQLGTATANEAAYAITDNPQLAESIRKRAGECVNAEQVKVVGMRECRISGNRCRVYEVV